VAAWAMECSTVRILMARSAIVITLGAILSAGLGGTARASADKNAAKTPVPRESSAGLCLAGRSVNRDGSARPYTVADGISYTRIDRGEPSDTGILSTAGILWSPDSNAFVIVTYCGDLRANVNRYELRLFRRSNATYQQESVLARFASALDQPGISLVRWLDNNTMAFLGTRRQGLTQLYRVTLAGRLEQLTHTTRPIVDYATSQDLETSVVGLLVPPDDSLTVQRGYVAGDMGEYFFSFGLRFPLFHRVTYATIDLPQRRTQIINLPALISVDGPEPSSVIIAPDGKWALLRTGSPHYNTSAVWLASLKSTAQTNTPVEFPAEMAGQFPGVLDAWWSPDGHSVLMLLTVKTQPLKSYLLVLTPPNPAVELVGSFATRPTALSDVRISASINFVTKGSDGLVRRTARYSSGSWSLGPDQAQRAENRGDDSHGVEIVESMSKPPDLFYRPQPGAQQPKRLTELNPQLSDLDLGRAKEFVWTDTLNRKWTGALLLPSAPAPPNGYPIVVQTHGYSPGRFVLTGPRESIWSGYAGRALLSRGIAVLQVPDDYSAFQTDQEIPDNVNVIASAIAAVTKAGIVDSNRIGLHGASRSGFYVHAALANSSLIIAAASIADADSDTRAHALSGIGIGQPPIPAILERMWGLPPIENEGGPEAWAKGDLANYPQRIRAPLLIQTYRGGKDAGWWSIYAPLRIANHPVEYVYYPDTYHSPLKPLDRYSVLESTTDWYDFWLNGHEDPDATKAKQYSRWERLCDLRIAESPEQPTFCVPATKH
jgi:dipeptidyl aminopeptidase/acylaminoacyl peptidase